MRANSMFALLLLLYLLQGIPYGFQTKFLPLYLRASGVALPRITLFASLLSLPWIFKPLWAPLVDKFGTKRSWVTFNLAAMATLYFLASFLMSKSVALALFIVSSLNILSATQDIAVDSIKVHFLSVAHIGYGNTVQVVGYKCGSLIGGGLLGWLSSTHSWHSLYLVLSITYYLSMIIVVSPVFPRHLGNPRPGHTGTCAKESARPGTADAEHSTVSGESKLKRYYKVYNRVLGSPGTVWTVVYVLTYKMGEIGITYIFPMRLIDQGVDVSQMAVLTGVWCQAFSILGSFVGGTIVSSKQWNELLRISSVLTLLRVFTAVVLTWSVSDTNWYKLVCFDCLHYLLSGTMTTVAFTLMVTCSQRCQGEHTATHYTMLATCETLGKLLMTAMSGAIAAAIGYNAFFWLCVTLLLLPLLLLRFGSGLVDNQSKID